ncbi:MAG: SPOR domain-containing protein [Mariprofundaceae bacterium]|nr:SPOR domain-containing protein [Mariprofundaceae bacterium]
MARKDFAEVQASQLEGQGMGNMQSIFMVAGMLIVVGASFVGGFMLGEKQGKAKAKHAGKQHLLEQIAKQRHELETLKKMAGNQKHNSGKAATQVGELTFYNTLPNQKVAPAPLDASQSEINHKNKVTDVIRRELAQRGAQPTPVGIFKLQVGSYQRRNKAETLKARLEQKGFPAFVQQTMVPELGLWFRVYTGPYPDRRVAEQARLQVQTKMHITGLLLRDK